MSATHMLPSRASHLIIGSGPSGLVTAMTLARAGMEPLIIEEGESLPQKEPFSVSEMQRGYRFGGMTATVGNPIVNFAEASTLGGGSSINSGYCFRPTSDALEQMARNWKISDWRLSALAPDLDFVEQETTPVSLPTQEFHNEEAWLRAARACGLEPKQAMFFHRWVPSKGVLARRPLHELWKDEFTRRGVKFLTGWKAVRLTKQADQWSVLCQRANGERARISAPEVFLCAGATETPALLRKSGIRKNIGDHLGFHLFSRALARFPWDLNRDACPLFPWKFFGTEFTIGHSPSLPHLMALFDPGLKDTLETEWRQWAAFYISISSDSSAKIRSSGFQSPLIWYRASQEERSRLTRAGLELKEFLKSAGAERIVPSRERRPIYQSVHLFGSCPMGENLEKCATNSYGEIHSQRGLHIHDCSLLGSSPGSNPQATVMALARRNTRRFLETR